MLRQSQQTGSVIPVSRPGSQVACHRRGIGPGKLSTSSYYYDIVSGNSVKYQLEVLLNLSTAILIVFVTDMFLNILNINPFINFMLLAH